MWKDSAGRLFPCTPVSGRLGVAVSEVAEKVIFSSLVEEPQLFFRTFLEKLTHKDRQVKTITNMCVTTSEIRRLTGEL